MILNKSTLSLFAFLLMATLCSNNALGAPTIGVHVDVKCKDDTIKYNVEKVIHSSIKSTEKYKLDTSDLANKQIKLAILPIRNPEATDEVIGLSIAVLVVENNQDGGISIEKFTNLLTTPDKYEEKIKNVVESILK